MSFVIDSGANRHFISPATEVIFKSSNECIPIKTATGLDPIQGSIVNFKENSHKLQTGVAHPNMRNNLASVSELAEAGFEVCLRRRGAHVKFPNGETQLLRRENRFWMLDVTFKLKGDCVLPTSPTKNPTSSKVQLAEANLTKSAKQMLDHKRKCHLYTTKNRYGRHQCAGCMQGKSGKKPHAKVRKTHLKSKYFGDAIHCDHWGPMHVRSLGGNRVVLHIKDDATSWSECYPHRARDEAITGLEEWCGQNQYPKSVRADNAREFRYPNTPWRRFGRKHGIRMSFCAAGEPEQSGLVERGNRTLFDSLLAVIASGVDIRLWAYLIVAICFVWNRLDRGKIESPYKKRFKREFDGENYFKVLGCVCFFKQHVRAKGEPRRIKGVFLGYSTESPCWLVGYYTSTGRFETVLAYDVWFKEDELVGDVEDLMPPKVRARKATSTAGNSGGAALGSTGGAQPKRGRPPKNKTTNKKNTKAKTTDGQKQSTKPKTKAQKRARAPEKAESAKRKRADPDESPQKSAKKSVDPAKTGDSQNAPKLNNPSTKRTVKPKSVLKNSEKSKSKQTVNGGSHGQKPKAPAKPTPKTKNTKTSSVKTKDNATKKSKSATEKPKVPKRNANGKSVKAPKSSGVRKHIAKAKYVDGFKRSIDDILEAIRDSSDVDVAGNAMCLHTMATGVARVESETFDEKEICHALLTEGHRLDALADLEEAAFAEVYMTNMSEKQAFSTADKEKYLAARSVERASLEAKVTWSLIKPAELKPGDRVLPCIAIYQRKSCGRYKCRLVVLGNREKGTDIECFSPTVSSTATKMTFIEAASQGMSCSQYDISVAFVNASLNRRVVVSLPEGFHDGKGSSLAILLRALYGLKTSPRDWFMCLRDALMELGWVPCEAEPALFRKRDKQGRIMLHMAYVDDGTIFAHSKEEAEHERHLVLQKFAGRKEEPTRTDSDGTEHRVLLGLNIQFNSKKRTVCMLQDQYIVKALERHGLKDAAPTATPGYDEKGDGKSPDAYPFRAVVGSLMWASTFSRPDISYPVKLLSERLASPGASSVTAAKRTLKYLKGTKHHGLIYSPQLEREFNSEDPEEDPESSGMLRAYCDSAYADGKDARSTSGNLVFYRGTAVWWRSRAQSLVTLSTCEAEFVSAFEAAKELVYIRQLSLFIRGLDSGSDCVVPLMCDNQSAIQVATSVLMSTKRTRHFKTRFYWLREATRNFVNIKYINTKFNRADALTKPLARKVLDFATRRISIDAYRAHLQKGDSK